MKTIRLRIHLDPIEAFRVIKLLDDLRDALAAAHAEDIVQALQPADDRRKSELNFKGREPPF